MTGFTHIRNMPAYDSLNNIAAGVFTSAKHQLSGFSLQQLQESYFEGYRDAEVLAHMMGIPCLRPVPTVAAAQPEPAATAPVSSTSEPHASPAVQAVGRRDATSTARQQRKRSAGSNAASATRVADANADDDADALDDNEDKLHSEFDILPTNTDPYFAATEADSVIRDAQPLEAEVDGLIVTGDHDDLSGVSPSQGNSAGHDTVADYPASTTMAASSTAGPAGTPDEPTLRSSASAAPTAAVAVLPAHTASAATAATAAAPRSTAAAVAATVTLRAPRVSAAATAASTPREPTEIAKAVTAVMVLVNSPLRRTWRFSDSHSFFADFSQRVSDLLEMPRGPNVALLRELCLSAYSYAQRFCIIRPEDLEAFGQLHPLVVQHLPDVAAHWGIMLRTMRVCSGLLFPLREDGQTGDEQRKHAEYPRYVCTSKADLLAKSSCISLTPINSYHHMRWHCARASLEELTKPHAPGNQGAIADPGSSPKIEAETLLQQFLESNASAPYVKAHDYVLVRLPHDLLLPAVVIAIVHGTSAKTSVLLPQAPISTSMNARCLFMLRIFYPALQQVATNQLDHDCDTAGNDTGADAIVYDLSTYNFILTTTASILVPLSSSLQQSILAKPQLATLAISLQNCPNVELRAHLSSLAKESALNFLTAELEEPSRKLARLAEVKTATNCSCHKSSIDFGALIAMSSFDQVRKALNERACTKDILALFIRRFADIVLPGGLASAQLSTLRKDRGSRLELVEQMIQSLRQMKADRSYLVEHMSDKDFNISEQNCPRCTDTTARAHAPSTQPAASAATRAPQFVSLIQPSLSTVCQGPRHSRAQGASSTPSRLPVSAFGFLPEYTPARSDRSAANTPKRRGAHPPSASPATAAVPSTAGPARETLPRMLSFPAEHPTLSAPSDTQHYAGPLAPHWLPVPLPHQMTPQYYPMQSHSFPFMPSVPYPAGFLHAAWPAQGTVHSINLSAMLL